MERKLLKKFEYINSKFQSSRSQMQYVNLIDIFTSSAKQEI